MKPVSLRHGQEAHIAFDGHVVVSGHCTVTGKPFTTPPIAIEGLLAWSNGAHIQDAIPNLVPSDREFLMSGITPEGWHQAGLDDEGDEELVPLEDMEDEDLEAIVKMAKTGGNELAQSEAREAQKILDNRAEAAGSRKAELDFRHYWEGRPTSEDRERDQLRDAGRFRG